METLIEQIEAVIGVWCKDGRTFYVKRSEEMENYPNVSANFCNLFRKH